MDDQRAVVVRTQRLFLVPCGEWVGMWQRVTIHIDDSLVDGLDVPIVAGLLVEDGLVVP